MSADNWTTCPRCTAKHEAKVKEAAAALAEAYGKVTVEEFDTARAELRAIEQVGPDETFREDYEFYGAKDGTITADYGGECSVCGLTARLKHSVTFWPEPSR